LGGRSCVDSNADAKRNGRKLSVVLVIIMRIQCPMTSWRVCAGQERGSGLVLLGSMRQRDNDSQIGDLRLALRVAPDASTGDRRRGFLSREQA
jgi:hypothetical protein